MADERYAIYRADEPLEGLEGDCTAFCLEVPPELVDALRGATPEQMQEIGYAAVCLRAWKNLHIFEENGQWYARNNVHGQEWGDTRVMALYALAETVKAGVQQP